MKKTMQNKSKCRVRALLICAAMLLLAGACAPGQEAAAPGEVAPTASPAPAPSAAIEPPKPTLVPTPSPSMIPVADPIADIVQSLTDRELIGQMVMCGFSGSKEPAKEFVELMKTYRLGSVILFSGNVHADKQTATLTAALNRYNPMPDIPLMIATDVEGGTVRRFSSWSPDIRSAHALGKKGDTQFTYDQFVRIANRLKEAGINMNLAPAMDIAPTMSGTFLQTRMFGGEPEEASVQIAAAIAGLHDGGVASVGKHFPGHGNTRTDSHSSTPVLQTTKEQLTGYELIPFIRGMEAGVDGIMIGHLLYEQIDPENPATVSPTIITGILREELGFQGVVISDDMVMRGLTARLAIEEAAVQFIEAGGDIALIGRGIDRQRDVLEALYAARESGRISRERLEQSVYRILTLKAKRMGL